MPFSLALSPEGHLISDDLIEAGFAFPSAFEAPAREALLLGDAATLLWLASFKGTQGLPVAALFWREFAGRYLTRFCQTGGRSEVAALSESESLEIIEQAPPMRGAEYLAASALNALWLALGGAILEGTARHEKGVEGWLREGYPHWHLVGRVTLHLAENKKDLERPFAFLATYTNGLTTDGRPRHLPLQQAIKEYAGAQNRAILLNLLEPMSRAAEKSAWARQQVESSAIYRPQGWTPGLAYSFLKEVPTLEECGLAIRIPDWWKTKAPPRPKVTVTVGSDAPKTFDKGGLLSFQIELSMNGEKLTPEELLALRTAEGLALVKGQWVEADAEKLQAVFAHWRQAHAIQFTSGISFLQAMRLLSGASIEGGEQKLLTEDIRSWSGIEAGPSLDAMLRDLRDPSRLDEIADHPDLKATLRPYQRDGVNWLHFMVRLGLGACLADDMGLGKTMQVIALLLHLKRTAPDDGPSLLVGPASLMMNWQAEVARFAPSLRVFIAHSSGSESERLASFVKGQPSALKGIDLVITTYGMMLRVDALKRTPWRLAILDEAQAIKNPAAAQTRAVKEVKAKARIALTGTPVENRLGDLWSLFDYLNPGLLGGSTAFSKFTKSLAKDSNHYAPLRRLVKPYILRRLKTDKTIISDLPDKTEMNAWCLLTKPQAILYQRVVDQLAKDLAQTEEPQKSGLILGALMAFKQICNHPAQHSGDAHYEAAQSGKFMRLRELCQPIAERQERVLLFTQFTEIIPALRELLKGVFNRDGLVLTGQTDIKERRQLVDEFQRDGGPPFFILSLKAGGTGLTLTAASHVIHFDRWWNPAVENQATDRAFRIGQKKNVLVHKFVCRGTLEEKIDRVINEKRALADGVLANGGELALNDMSNEELLSFVALDVNQIAGEE